MKPFLSICICTRNQPSHLQETLKSVFDRFNSNIEVLVCDDSDNAKFKKVSKDLGSLPIKFFSGRKKGLDCAILDITKKATGDYIWWLGDDALTKGAIVKIIHFLKSNPKLIFLWVNSADSNNINLTTFSKPDSEVFEDRNILLSIGSIGLLGFISATIFKREEALDSLNKAEKYVGSAFVCLYIIMSVLVKRGQIGYFSEVCFLSKTKKNDDKRWFNPSTVFGINLPKITNEFKNIFTSKNYRFAINQNIHQLLKAIVYERATSTRDIFGFNFSLVPEFVRIYWSYPIFWLFLPFLVAPRQIVKLILRPLFLYKRHI